MQMENMVAAKPQNTLRMFPWRARRETAATAPKTDNTRSRRAVILRRSFLEAQARKMTTYSVSMAAPVPLMVLTSMLLGDTNGSPYLPHTRLIVNLSNVLWVHICSYRIHGNIYGIIVSCHYQAERRQFRRVETQGTPENCSVDLFLTILWKVILCKEGETKCQTKRVENRLIACV